ncbi:MAG: putative bifunctional diguanylate cyclase/phosphodiesterase [Pseudomonadales bacterium]
MNALTVRLFIILSAITLIVMSGFVTLRYQSNAQLMCTALEERSSAVAERVASSVQLTIWNIYRKTYDRRYSVDFTAAILDAEMKPDFVKGIKVFGNFGHLFTGKIKVNGQIVDYDAKLHDQLWHSDENLRRYPIREGQMTIGNVEIIYSDQEFAANLRQSLILDITQVAIVSLLFIFSLYWILNRALVAPLKSLQVAERALRSLDEAVFVLDERGLLIDINPSYSKMTKYSLKRIRGQEPPLFAREHPQKSVIELLALNDGNSWSGEVVGKRRCGTKFPGWLNVHKVVGRDHSITYVAVLNDIAEKQKAEEKLHQLAYFDSLTKVANRYSFMQSLEHEINLAAQRQQSIALLYIDLDNFKWINDSFGHQVGDKLLVELSQRFSNRLRAKDVLYRIGGDEFTVIVKDYQDEAGLGSFAASIVNLAAQELKIEGHVMHPGVSVGIATYPQDADSSALLIKRADSAMFQAKQQGRGQVCFFSSELERVRLQDQQIVEGLQRALTEGEFALYLQPKVSLGGKGFTTCGVEALLRWQREGEFLYPPDVFIPVAERHNMICEIGYWVMEQACRQLVSWRELGIRDVSIAINLSPKQLKDDHLYQRLSSLISEYKVRPGELEVEITESAVIEDINSSIVTLQRLRTLGVSVSMDDFGTGYSSLSYLKQLPIDVLKIDRSFIYKVPRDPDDVAIVKAIFSMAHALGIEVVAEGIETREQLEFLIENNCQIGQGYYFSKPLSADAFYQWHQQGALTASLSYA